VSLQFIIGRSGSGKSEYCLNAVRDRLRADPDGAPIVLLVPEQASYLAEYALVTTPGLAGTVRAQVLSFRRLAYRILQETGGIDRQALDDVGKKMLLYRILERRRSELKTLMPERLQPGYLDALLELIRELKRYDHSPEQLADFAGRLDRLMPQRMPLLEDKLHDLRLIYGEYEQALAASYFDADNMYPLAAARVAEAAVFSRSEFWIDGFHGFTPQELKVVEALLAAGADVKMTLCLDRPRGPYEKPHELDLFHPTAVTMSKLCERAGELNVPVLDPIVLDEPAKGRFRLSPMLAHLEKHFQRPVPWVGAGGTNAGKPPEIRLYAAMNRRAEVEGAARDILRAARDEGLRWRDMAVIVRDLEAYLDLIERVFTDYGIPVFRDQKRSVVHHPLIEFVRAALDVVRTHWRYDSVFRCVKTDFFLVPGREDRRAMDELENYVLAFGIQGSLWTHPDRWTFRPSDGLIADEAEADAEEEPGKAMEAYLERIHRARMDVVRPLAAFERRVRQCVHAEGFVEALVALLDDVRAAERLERWSEAELAAGNPEKAREHVQVWSGLMDALDQIVEVLGQEPVGLDTFGDILEAGLKELTLGLVPPSLDQVLIGSPERTRAANIRRCYLLGVVDGTYPANLPENGILSEQERERLADAGFELAPGSRRRLLDDQFLIYSALTMAGEQLWLSYPLADEEGKALRPSELIRRVKRLFPRIEERFLDLEPNVSMDAAAQAEFVAGPEQALPHLLAQLRRWTRGEEIAPVWWDAYNWFAAHPAWRLQLGRRLAGLFYTNGVRPLGSDLSRALYGPVLRAGVSRLERFASCPFAHYASYGLRLKPRRIYRLEAPDVGQLFHAALGILALELRRERLSWGELTPAENERRAGEIVDRLAPRLQSRILLSSGRYRHITRKLKSIVVRAATVLGEHARRSDFVPVGLEVAFGDGAELPPLVFTLPGGVRMEIVGRIDRVDLARTDAGLFVRVIDYKSSRTSLRLGDIYHGLSLQMLTYLDVVLSNAERWLGEAVRPAGVLYFHVHRPLLQTDNPIPAEAAEAERFRRHRMTGLVTADTKAVHAMDRTLAQGETRSEIIPVALKKDGGFQAYSSVVTPEQWERLRRYVRAVIRTIGEEIMAGRADIAPYRDGDETPCRFCEYRAVCQFDPAFGGNAYRRLADGSKDVWWALMERAAAEADSREERAGRRSEAEDDREGGADHDDNAK
jgi:ATP-dependent helicase/nuclease subunit B